MIDKQLWFIIEIILFHLWVLIVIIIVIFIIIKDVYKYYVSIAAGNVLLSVFDNT